jgi:hypothetical protein
LGVVSGLAATVDFEVGTTRFEAWGIVTTGSKSTVCSVDAGAWDSVLATGVAGSDSAAAEGMVGGGAPQVGPSVAIGTGATGVWGAAIGCDSANGSAAPRPFSLTVTLLLGGCGVLSCGVVWNKSDD